MIIDIHCHIYPEKIAQKASDAVGVFYGITMKNDGMLNTMLNNGKKVGVTHYVVHSVATVPHQTHAINSFIAETVEQYSDCMIGFGTVHPNGNVENDVAEIVDLGLKGIKLHPDFQKFQLDSDKSMEIFQQAQKYDLPVLIHTGDKRYDYSNPNRLIPVLKAFPKVTVIGAHFGGWSIWEDAAHQLYTFENLLVDCSSSFYGLPPQKATEIIKIYGADRVLFGSDFPMWNVDEEVKKLKKLDLSQDELDKILYKNSKKLLNI